MESQSVRKSVWSEWKPSEKEPWDFRRVVHLHRRAGFGATWSEIEQDVADGPEAAVERILAGKSQRDGVPEQFSELARTIGEAAVAAGSIDRLKAWWVYRMLMTPDPLSERIALMWHNHFATSQLKVENVSLMAEQNQVFREHGQGKFGELLRKVIKQPAMLIWLDADANRKQHPNENLAREIMELFTLGEGNYTEADIKEAARALTGWTVSRNQFRNVPAYHDPAEKTLFGKTGRFDGDDLLDQLIDHPATARRIAWRLCDTFLGENQATKAAIDELAERVRASELNVQEAVRTILKSEAFFAEAGLCQRVRSPVDFVVGTIRALELFDPPPSTLILAETLEKLGQDLFFPPNVFGWQGGRSWINTRSLVGRSRFVGDLVEGRLHQGGTPSWAIQLANKYHAGDTERQVQFFARLLLGQNPDPALVPQIEKHVSAQSPDKAKIVGTIVFTILTQPEVHLG